MNGITMINALVETFCGTLVTAVFFYAVNEINSARLVALQQLYESEPELMKMLGISSQEANAVSPDDDKTMQSMDIDELFYVCSQLSNRSLKMFSSNDPQAMLAYNQFVHYTRHLVDKCMDLKVTLERQEDVFSVLYQPLRSRHISQIEGMILNNYTSSQLMPIRHAASELNDAFIQNVTELQKPQSNALNDVVALYTKFNTLFDGIDSTQYPEDLLSQINQIKKDVGLSVKDHMTDLNSLFQENHLIDQPDLFRDRPGTTANNLIAYFNLLRESDGFVHDLDNYNNLKEISSAMNATTLKTPGSGYTMPTSVINRANEMRDQMHSLNRRSAAKQSHSEDRSRMPEGPKTRLDRPQQ